MRKSFAKISIIAGIIICICGIIFLCSCQGSRFGDDQNKKIIDSWGREVAIPRTIDRIATVGAATRLVVYAGAQDKLVAITDMDRPTELRPYTLAYPELFSSLPSTNNGNALNETTVDEEKLLELKPDVIISTRSADECDNLQSNTKIPVVGINITKNLKTDSFASILKVVGEATMCTEKANTLAGYYKSILNEIDINSPGTSETFYRGAINYKGSKDLTGTYSHYCLYPYLKSTNVADIEGIEGPYDTSLEQILT